MRVFIRQVVREIYFVIRRLFLVFVGFLFLFCPHRNKNKAVLVVLANKIGDFIIFSPSLSYLKKAYPHHTLVVLTDKSVSSLLPSFSEVDEYIPINVKKFQRNFFYAIKIFFYLYKKRFSVALYPVYSRSFTGDELVKMSGALERVGFVGDDSNLDRKNREKNNSFFTRLINDTTSFAKGYPEVERCKYFCEKILGETIKGPFCPNIIIHKDIIHRGNELLKSHQWKGQNYVVIVLGTGLAYRRWPIDRFLKIINHLSNKGFVTVFVGGKDEADLSEQITTQHHSYNIVNLIGDANLLEVGGILKGALFCFGMDTATLHLAAAVGTPTVCLLGGGYFDRFAPYGDSLRHKIVYDEHMHCKYDGWLCAQKGGFRKTPPCVLGITVQSAITQIDALLVELQRSYE